MKIIKSKNAPQAIGPYSQAIISNGFVFTSGQIGLDPNSDNLISKEFKIQAYQVFENIRFILEDSGSNLDSIIKMNIFLTDLSDFDELNKLMSKFLNLNKLPARSTVQVSSLPKDAIIEIDVVAKVLS